MTTDAQPKPWDRRADETSKAYAGFVAYLQMGPQRSLVAAHAAVYGGNEKAQDGRRAPRFFTKWSTKFDWVARARAFDDHELAEQIAGRERVRERVRQRALDVSLDLVEELHTIAKGCGRFTDTGAPASKDQIAAADMLLALAGATPPKQLEVSGRDGGPIATRHDERPALRELLANPAAVPHLRALAELQATADDSTDEGGE